MTRRLVYLPTAEFDFSSIYDLIAADSPNAALRFVGSIRSRLDALSDFPGMGRSVDGTVYRITFDRKVLVLYGFDEQTVWITSIRYLGQQWP